MSSEHFEICRAFFLFLTIPMITLLLVRQVRQVKIWIISMLCSSSVSLQGTKNVTIFLYLFLIFLLYPIKGNNVQGLK